MQEFYYLGKKFQIASITLVAIKFQSRYKTLQSHCESLHFSCLHFLHFPVSQNTLLSIFPCKILLLSSDDIYSMSMSNNIVAFWTRNMPPTPFSLGMLKALRFFWFLRLLEAFSFSIKISNWTSPPSS